MGFQQFSTNSQFVETDAESESLKMISLIVLFRSSGRPKKEGENAKEKFGTHERLGPLIKFIFNLLNLSNTGTSICSCPSSLLRLAYRDQLLVSR